jgi:hypothetical protein
VAIAQTRFDGGSGCRCRCRCRCRCCGRWRGRWHLHTARSLSTVCVLQGPSTRLVVGTQLLHPTGWWLCARSTCY